MLKSGVSSKDRVVGFYYSSRYLKMKVSVKEICLIKCVTAYMLRVAESDIIW